MPALDGHCNHEGMAQELLCHLSLSTAEKLESQSDLRGSSC